MLIAWTVFIPNLQVTQYSEKWVYSFVDTLSTQIFA